MDRAEIQRAALFRFATHGYEATTLRLLAQDLGVTPAAFYYHFKNKDELLTALIEEIVTGDLEMLRKIRRDSAEDPLDALIYAHVYGMCHGREEALVVEREARYLSDPFRARVGRIVHQYESVFEECIRDDYHLSGDDLTLATRAVIGLGGSVVQWFRQGGSFDEHEVALDFTRYARGMLDRAAADAGKGQPRHELGSSANGDEPFGEIGQMIRDRVAARRRIGAAASA